MDVEFGDGFTAEDGDPPLQFYSKIKCKFVSMIGAPLGQNENPINGSGDLESNK